MKNFLNQLNIEKMNQFQSFSNIAPNSSIMDEIIQNSAFELIKIKKALILQMSENIQMGYWRIQQIKLKSIFLKKTNIFSKV